MILVLPLLLLVAAIWRLIHMVPPTAPTYYSQDQTEFIWAIESSAAGTPGTVIIREPCQVITPQPMRTIYTSTGYIGKPVSRWSADETQHHEQITLRLEARWDGFATMVVLAMHGNGSETAAGTAGAYTHTAVRSMGGNRCNTFTIWIREGDTGNYIRVTKATVQDIAFSLNAENAMVADITLVGNFGTIVAPPTITSYVGSTANYEQTLTMGSQGTYVIKNSAGASYPNNITSCAFSFHRDVTLLPNMAGLNPADICPGEMSFAVTNLQFEYDGLAVAAVYRDYRDFLELGSSSAKHSMTFTNANSHGLSVTWYPGKWGDGSTLDNIGDVIMFTGNFVHYDQLAAANVASSAKATQPEQTVITNNLTGALTT